MDFRPTHTPSQSRTSTLTNGGLPISLTEFNTLPENEKYAVAVWLSNKGSNSFRRFSWSPDDETELLRVYEGDASFQAEVARIIESKTTVDPRRRR